MSNGQIHAPPTEEEYEKIQADKAAGKILANESKVLWREHGGWCSACFVLGVTVVHYGTEERNFALCGECIVRMGDVFTRASDTSSTDTAKGGG